MVQQRELKNTLQSALLVTGISYYINNKRQRENYTFRHNGKNGFWLVGDQEVTDKEFNQIFPLNLTGLNNEDICGSTNWRK